GLRDDPSRPAVGPARRGAAVSDGRRRLGVAAVGLARVVPLLTSIDAPQAARAMIGGRRRILGGWLKRAAPVEAIRLQRCEGRRNEQATARSGSRGALLGRGRTGDTVLHG